MLDGQGNNGYGVTYTIKDGPKYGTLVAGPTPGTFVYTANDTLIAPGITDSFTITVDNGDDARLPGVAGMLQGLLHSFAIRIGAAKADTIDAQFNVEVKGTGVYGDQQAAQEYWVSQSYSNCQLQAAASAVSQATKTKPADNIEQQWVQWAKTTDSISTPGAKMYLDANIDEGASTVDAIALMEAHYDVTATRTLYDPSQAGGQKALLDLQAALADGKAAMVAYPVAIVWTGAGVGFIPEDDTKYDQADHAAVVTAVDLANGVVYVNDSSMTDNPPEGTPARPNVGRGKAIPIGVFMAGWQVAKYDLTIVSAKAPAVDA
jgi:hypothetical protein